jgi:DNA-binding transcriptional ArsR family regulator
MQLIDDSGTRSVQCKELSPEDIKATTCKLAARILSLLAEHPQGMHAAQLAKSLKEHEQKVYYHTRRLLKAGIITIQRVEDTRGGTAKILSLKSGAFAVRLQEYEPLARVATYTPSHLAFLSPFIEEGRLHAKIVIGSPDPHGPEHARSRDANYAIDLGIFLGTYLSSRAPPAVLLDTELRDWGQNLIIIGGPVVNKAAERINAKSPARYDRELKAFIIKDKAYSQEEAGIIVKMPNPFAKGKWILHIAGRRSIGTRAAVLAFLTSFDKICAVPAIEGTHVAAVEGIDADSDGVVEDVRFIG